MDDTETYASWADEILLVARHEAARRATNDAKDPAGAIIRRRLEILARVEELLRQAHAAGRVPKQQSTEQ